MNFRERLCFSVVIAVAVAASYQVSGHNIKDIKCLGEKIDLSTFFSGFMECAAGVLSQEDFDKLKDPNTSPEIKKEIGKRAHENTCISVCQWKNHTHMLTADGKINEEKLPEIIKIFPEAAREPFTTGLKKCDTDHASAFSDADNCKGYKGFAECLHVLYKDVCKEEMPCE
ncbi:hypothetical protein Ocin01_10289 [Orchesella cincta]|uniref:Uncharacterized protein n=1 Tax=Orchesella cincta TaxID=48709 RepID=A0A1D2MU15_ORCCI|nr:hypothetical protein Ocin01_10289 [Orchesella cincta]